MANDSSGPVVDLSSTAALYRRLQSDSADRHRLDIGEGAVLFRQIVAAVSHSGCAETYLCLNFCKIDDEEAKALAKSLKVNTTLTTLHLSNNRIGGEGAAALAEALKVNKALTFLDIGHTHIGDKGAAALAEALEVNTTLITLDIGDNHISDEGATVLAKALKVNTTLITLYLGYNHISEEGATALAEALNTNTKLTSLRVFYNEAKAKHIDQMLARNRYLARLGPKLAEFVSSRSWSDIVNTLDANKDNLSILFDLIKHRNDWIHGN